VKANPVVVPPSMLKDQKKALIDDMKQKMVDQGMSDTEFQDYATKWDGDFNTTAAEMIQAGFLVDAIAAKESLRCTAEDLKLKIEEYSKQTGLEVEKVREFYQKPEQTQRLTYMITEEKVVAYLTTHANVTEVTKAALKEGSN
jgi:trigger factor